VILASIPSAPADLELIAQLKNKLQYAELRIRVLEEHLRLMRIEKYGAGGERLSQAQMQLFELEPVVSEMTEQAESERAQVHRSTKRSAKHPGRQELPANLPRVERILPCGIRSARMQALRKRDSGDRLRREFPVGCGAGEVFRAGHETREAGLEVV
jgi:transposase IS166 family protein